MLFLYLLVAAFGAFFFFAPELLETDTDPSSDFEEVEAKVMGVFYGGLGVVLAAAYVVALLTPRRFWGWVYNLVMIAFGMTSPCCLPMTIPLLIYWIKPEVRMWYRGEELAEAFE